MTQPLCATSYRNSNEILAMRHSYTGGLSLLKQSPANQRGYRHDICLSVNYVPYRLRALQDMQDEDFTKACVVDLQQILDTATTGNVACLIFEPIQGVGVCDSPDGFYGEMSKVLSNYGTLDKRRSANGLGKTGEHFECQAHGITPDMYFCKGRRKWNNPCES